MEPKIVKRNETILIGMDFCGDPFKSAPGWSHENEVGKLWQRFDSFFTKHKDKIKNMKSDAGYEVWVETDDHKERGDKYVFIGVEVERVEDLPLEMVVKILPAATFAVFTVRGKDIKSNWGAKIYEEWLPSSPYKESYPFMFEHYDPARFKGMESPESELDIYVPVTE